MLSSDFLKETRNTFVWFGAIHRTSGHKPHAREDGQREGRGGEKIELGYLLLGLLPGRNCRIDTRRQRKTKDRKRNSSKLKQLRLSSLMSKNKNIWHFLVKPSSSSHPVSLLRTQLELVHTRALTLVVSSRTEVQRGSGDVGTQA